MKVLVIGGVAAGTKAAAKIKRQNRSAEVKILTQSADISYAGCGLPYYVGGMIESREELIVNTPEKYTGLTGVEVVTRCEVTSVNFQAKTVTALCQGQTWLESYDKLVIATGATPFVPQVEGIRLPLASTPSARSIPVISLNGVPVRTRMPFWRRCRRAYPAISGSKIFDRI